MKTERRHELEANALAQHIERFLDRLRPYSSAILAVISAGLILVAAYSYLSQRNRASTAEAWYVYHQAANSVDPDIARLQLIVTEYPGEPVANFARLVIAEASLGKGIEALFNDRAAAEKDLAEAEKYFKELLASARERYLLDRAHLGLGKVYESRNELDMAKEQYSQIGESSALYAYAQDRQRDLADPNVRDFYDWFAEQKPTPPREPSGGPLDLSLPDRPLPGENDDGPFLFPDAKSSRPGDASSESPHLAPGATGANAEAGDDASSKDQPQDQGSAGQDGGNEGSGPHDSPNGAASGAAPDSTSSSESPSP